MRQWKRIKIEDIGSLSNGINFDKSSYVAGAKLIGVSDFKDRLYPDYDNLQQVSIDAVKEGDYLKKGDIVFVRSNGNKNLVGRCMIIDKNLPVTYSGFCIRLRIKDTAKYNPLFFAYLFKSTDFRNSMANNAVGANIQNLNQKRLGGYEPLVPDYRTQLHIASILSKYDTLIENYQQQIKLLEEAAQRLYKEWFVDFHFPGYENTKIVNGVPEGWEKETLGNIVPILTGKKDANFADVKGKYPFFTCAQDILNAPSYSFDGSAVLLAGNGDFNIKLYRGKFEAYQRTYVLIPKELKYLFLIYNAIATNLDRLSSRAAGSTIKFLTKGMISSIPILIPSALVLKEYNCLSEEIQNKIELLRLQLRLLTEARDRLLPKLMSGEIEV